MREGCGKEISWLQTLRSWKCWKCQKSILDDSMQRHFSCHRTETNCYSLSQMDQSSWQEKLRYCEDPPKDRNMLQEESCTTMFFKESRTSLNHEASIRMTQKLETISGVYLGVIFIVITFIQELIYVPKEGSLFHSSTLCVAGKSFRRLLER